MRKHNKTKLEVETTVKHNYIKHVKIIMLQNTKNKNI